MTKLFVGSLPFETNEEELNKMFAAFGAVASAKLINDRDTGRGRSLGGAQTWPLILQENGPPFPNQPL